MTHTEIGICIRKHIPGAVIVRQGGLITVFADRRRLFTVASAFPDTLTIIRDDGKTTTLYNNTASFTSWLEDFHAKLEDQCIALCEALGREFSSETIERDCTFLNSLLDVTDPPLGAKKGRLVVIASRPGLGKTTWALQICRDYEKAHGTSARFWNQETKPESLQRHLAELQATKIVHDVRGENKDLEKFLADENVESLEVVDGFVTAELVRALKKKAMANDCDIVVTIQAPRNTAYFDGTILLFADVVLLSEGVGLPLVVMKDRYNDGRERLWASVPLIPQENPDA